jgi:hypothetical protein
MALLRSRRLHDEYSDCHKYRGGERNESGALSAIDCRRFRYVVGGFGLLGELILVFVRRVRGFEPVSVGVHELVPDDGISAKAGNKILLVIDERHSFSNSAER